jgi:DNA-binding LacI/PurR family transcriptional regulator
LKEVLPLAAVDKPATSADVAKLANVSRTTVSYILNNVPGRHISAATRDRILAAAEQLGYTPHAAARALRAGRNQLVLALVPDWDMGPTFSAGMEALNRLLADRGYILVIHSHSDTVRPLTALWSEVRPAIVMVFGSLKDEHAKALRAAGIKYTDARMLEYLTGISRLQSEHLWRSGHRSLGYLQPSHYVPRDILEFRRAGVKEFCAEYGLESPRQFSLDYGLESVHQMEEQWFQGPDPVTGVIAHTDELAAFVWNASSADFTSGGSSLIGTGDRPIARLGLTTVGFDFDKVAFFWAENALAALEQRSPVEDLEYPGWVVQRQTA